MENSSPGSNGSLLRLSETPAPLLALITLNEGGQHAPEPGEVMIHSAAARVWMPGDPAARGAGTPHSRQERSPHGLLSVNKQLYQLAMLRRAPCCSVSTKFFVDTEIWEALILLELF